MSRLRRFVRVRFNFDGTLELLVLSVSSECNSASTTETWVVVFSAVGKKQIALTISGHGILVGIRHATGAASWA